MNSQKNKYFNFDQVCLTYTLCGILSLFFPYRAFAQKNRMVRDLASVKSCSEKQNSHISKSDSKMIESKCLEIERLVKNFKILAWNDLMPRIGKNKQPGHLVLESTESPQNNLDIFSIESAFLIESSSGLEVPLILEKSLKDSSITHSFRYNLFSPEKIKKSQYLILIVLFKNEPYSIKVNLPEQIEDTH